MEKGKQPPSLKSWQNIRYGDVTGGLKGLLSLATRLFVLKFIQAKTNTAMEVIADLLCGKRRFITQRASNVENVSITMRSLWAQWRLKSSAPRLFTQPFIQAQINEKSKFHVTGLREGNSRVTGEFPSQAGKAENVSIWWHHHALPRHHPCINEGQHIIIF